VNWLDIVGWAGSALLVWSLLQSRILRLRALNLVGSVVLIGYNAALAVWPMVGLNVVLAVINVWYLYRMIATRHDERTYQVVEVGTGDEFLAHTLRVHAADIARFNPGFRWDGDGDGRSAFMVVRDDEVVGVVLIRAATDSAATDRTATDGAATDSAAADGTAQIELDYVTQRYRDFTPGEFVYRRSRLFTDRGFRRVVTPPGMVAPYYGRIGFRPEADSYVLDLPAPGDPDHAP